MKQSDLLLRTDIENLEAPVEWDTGVAVTSGNYELGRDADSTNQLHFNVPSGATFELSIEDVPELVIGADSLTITSDAGIDITASTAEIDVDIVTLSVTGTPKFSWDDSQDQFAVNKGVDVTSGTLTFNEVDDGNSSTADTIDWTAGPKHKSTLTGDCTYTFTAPAGPTNLMLTVIQDGTGGRTATWPGTVKWPRGGGAPTLSTAADAVDLIGFYWNGTAYYGESSLNYS